MNFKKAQALGYKQFTYVEQRDLVSRAGDKAVEEAADFLLACQAVNA